MRDNSFTLSSAATAAVPPFAYFNIATPQVSFWRVRDGNGALVAGANTRAGARAAVHALYRRDQVAEAAAAMRATA